MRSVNPKEDILPRHLPQIIGRSYNPLSQRKVLENLSGWEGLTENWKGNGLGCGLMKASGQRSTGVCTVRGMTH